MQSIAFARPSSAFKRLTYEDSAHTPDDSSIAALDALAQQLDEKDANTLIVVLNMRPDEFFTAAQQYRLGELLAKRCSALDARRPMDVLEKAELESLIDAVEDFPGLEADRTRPAFAAGRTMISRSSQARVIRYLEQRP